MTTSPKLDDRLSYKEVLALARQAGFSIYESNDPNAPRSWHGQAHNDRFERFAELLSALRQDSSGGAGPLRCQKHGGYGFSSDCPECHAAPQESRSEVLEELGTAKSLLGRALIRLRELGDTSFDLAATLVIDAFRAEPGAQINAAEQAKTKRTTVGDDLARGEPASAAPEPAAPQVENERANADRGTPSAALPPVTAAAPDMHGWHPYYKAGLARGLAEGLEEALAIVSDSSDIPQAYRAIRTKIKLAKGEL